jgi:hypothetical protein
MSAMQRRKGQGGELEAARLLSDLTGHPVTRRVRQHGGDSDLVGLPGWAVEVKRARTAPLATVAGSWWYQACEQAQDAKLVPLLLYRADRQPWRCVWPAGLLTAPMTLPLSLSFTHALTGDPAAWWALCRSLRLG